METRIPNTNQQVMSLVLREGLLLIVRTPLWHFPQHWRGEHKPDKMSKYVWFDKWEHRHDEHYEHTSATPPSGNISVTMKNDAPCSTRVYSSRIDLFLSFFLLV